MTDHALQMQAAEKLVTKGLINLDQILANR